VVAEVTVTGGVAAAFTPFGIVDLDNTYRTDNTANTDRNDGLLPVAGIGRAGGNNIDLQLNVTGTHESGRVGYLMQLRPRYNGSSIAFLVGDNAELWFKPIDWIRIDAGRFVNNDIRGRMGSGAWFGDFTIPRAGENDIFQNFDGNVGVMASVKPAVVEGLGVYALVKSAALFGNAENGELTWYAGKRAEYVYENIQTAVSYALSDIGLARVQYFGATPNVTQTNTRFLPTQRWTITAPHFGAAFAFTGLSEIGLTIDVGGKFYLPFDGVQAHEGNLGENGGAMLGSAWPGFFDSSPTASTSGKFQAPHMAALGVKFELLPVTLSLLFNAKFGGYGEGTSSDKSGTVVTKTETKLELGPEIRGWLTANYKINDTFSAQAEGGIIYAGESDYSSTIKTSGAPIPIPSVSSSYVAGSDAFLYGFGLGLQTTFAKDCWVRVGATFTSGLGMGTSATSTDGDDAKSRPLPIASSFNIPITMQVSF
jgi:hypothetical protein